MLLRRHSVESGTGWCRHTECARIRPECHRWCCPVSKGSLDRSKPVSGSAADAWCASGGSQASSKRIGAPIGAECGLRPNEPPRWAHAKSTHIHAGVGPHRGRYVDTSQYAEFFSRQRVSGLRHKVNMQAAVRYLPCIFVDHAYLQMQLTSWCGADALVLDRPNGVMSFGVDKGVGLLAALSLPRYPVRIATHPRCPGWPADRPSKNGLARPLPLPLRRGRSRYGETPPK